MVVGGSFILRIFSQTKFDALDEKKFMTKLKKIPQKTPEELYEEYIANTDLDEWQNKRTPRPWEADNSHSVPPQPPVSNSKPQYRIASNARTDTT